VASLLIDVNRLADLHAEHARRVDAAGLRELDGFGRRVERIALVEAVLHVHERIS
jgi:hypothetical protein